MGANTDVVSDPRLAPQIPVLVGRSAGLKQVIDKHRAVRDHAVIPNRYQVTNKGVRLDLAPLANHRSALDLHKRPDESAVADDAAIQVYRLDDFDILAEAYLDNARTQQFRGSHVFD